MASQLLEDRLTCAICLGLYQDPVTLPCGHNFCRACVRDWWRRCDQECPACREPVPGRAELRRNVALSDVLEVVRAEPAPGAGPDPRPDPGARCPRHGRPLELFCRTDGRCVCSACTVGECRHHERALLDAERREREVTRRGAPLCSPARGQPQPEAASGYFSSKVVVLRQQMLGREASERGQGGQGEVRVIAAVERGRELCG